MPAAQRILYLPALDDLEAAVTWQVAQASKAFQASVVLLAVAPKHRWLRRFGAQSNGAQLALKAKLVEVAQRLREFKGHVSGVKVALGARVAVALEVADQIGAGLIMTGAGERSLRDPLHSSADALAIARSARQDVWICKPHADHHIEHILCAADISAGAGPALARSADLSRRFNARLRVLSVLDEPDWISRKTDANPLQDLDAEALARLQAQKSFLDQYNLGGAPLSRATVWAWNAAAEVLSEAETYSDGLLVMGGGGPRSATLRIGPTCDQVLQRCPSSLLIVKQGQSPRCGAGAGNSKAHHAEPGR